MNAMSLLTVMPILFAMWCNLWAAKCRTTQRWKSTTSVPIYCEFGSLSMLKMGKNHFDGGERWRVNVVFRSTLFEISETLSIMGFFIKLGKIWKNLEDFLNHLKLCLKTAQFVLNIFESSKFWCKLNEIKQNLLTSFMFISVQQKLRFIVQNIRHWEMLIRALTVSNAICAWQIGEWFVSTLLIAVVSAIFNERLNSVQFIIGTCIAYLCVFTYIYLYST